MKYQFRPYAKMQPTVVTLTGKVYEKGEHPLYTEHKIIEVIDEQGEIHYAFEDELKPDEVEKQELEILEVPMPIYKQKTLEEAMERLSNIVGVGGISDKHAFMLGTFWQQERSYSEEDMQTAFKVGFSIGYGSDVHAIDEKNRTCDEWFEQFKKK